jgi:hypothetical protein
MYNIPFHSDIRLCHVSELCETGQTTSVSNKLFYTLQKYMRIRIKIRHWITDNKRGAERVTKPILKEINFIIFSITYV